MVYLKTLLLGCIGLAVALVLRVVIWFVFAMSHGKNMGLTAHAGSRDSRLILGTRLLQDPLFLILAVVCVGLVVYLGGR